MDVEQQFRLICLGVTETSKIFIEWKEDRLERTEDADSTPTTLVPPSSPCLTLNSAEQSLAHELERRRARSAADGQRRSTRRFVGSVLRVAFSPPLSWLGSTTSTTTTTTTSMTQGAVRLSGDEVDVLANEDALAFKGIGFEWAKVEQALGLEIKWAAASSEDVSRGGIGQGVGVGDEL
ncbi:hypothetical protein JCM1840_004428 [Sporobolomyces johnsonii]